MRTVTALLALSVAVVASTVASAVLAVGRWEPRFDDRPSSLSCPSGEPIDGAPGTLPSFLFGPSAGWDLDGDRLADLLIPGWDIDGDTVPDNKGWPASASGRGPEGTVSGPIMASVDFLPGTRPGWDLGGDGIPDLWVLGTDSDGDTVPDVWVPGSVDGTGVSNSIDSLIDLQCIAGLLPGSIRYSADADLSGDLTAIDAALVLQVAAGLTSLPLPPVDWLWWNGSDVTLDPPTPTSTAVPPTDVPTESPTDPPVQTLTVVPPTGAPTDAPTNTPAQTPTVVPPTGAPTGTPPPVQTLTVVPPTGVPTGTPTSTPPQTPTSVPPTGVPTGTPPPAQTLTVVPPTGTPTNTPIVTPTPTQPGTPTTTATPEPTTPPVDVSSFSVAPGFCQATVSWDVPGDAQTVVVVLRDGAVIHQTSTLEGTYKDAPQGGLSGAYTWRLEVTNGMQQAAVSHAKNVFVPC